MYFAANDDEESRLLDWFLNRKMYNYRRAQFYKLAQLTRLSTPRRWLL
jgi:hypothetical protein